MNTIIDTINVIFFEFICLKRKIILTAVLFTLHSAFVYPDWSIEEPYQKIPKKELTGKVHGKIFTASKCIMNEHAISIKSKNKIGGFPAVEIVIFIGIDDLQWNKKPMKWLISHEQKQNVPHIHVKVMSKGREFPSVQMYTEGYSMNLELKGKKSAEYLKSLIHLSLPDHERSYLLGNFECQLPD